MVHHEWHIRISAECAISAADDIFYCGPRALNSFPLGIGQVKLDIAGLCARSAAKTFRSCRNYQSSPLLRISNAKKHIYLILSQCIALFKGKVSSLAWEQLDMF